jgi:daunorubicin resistance ABC transporter ATP-binding subunit
MRPAIVVEELVKTFRGGARALDGLSFSVPHGTVLGLLGPNGAGKTTAVRVLATLLRADSGGAWVHGVDVFRRPNDVARLIGLTGQYAAVDELLSGEENLYLVGRLAGLSRRDAVGRAADLLTAFGLGDVARRTAGGYSGGLRRRLDIAVSIVTKPGVLMLDEPTTGLDPRSRNQLWDQIRRLVAEGTTVLLTTQYLDEADALADDIVIVDHGRVVAAGPPDQLKKRVGGQRLEIGPVRPEHLVDTAALLSELTGGRARVDQQTRLVSVPAGPPAEVAEVLRRLDERGMAPAGMTMRGPSLDEVFLALTGRRT